MAYGPLDFYEAPDYASELEKDYQKINQGFERREEAERRNDQARLENARIQSQFLQTAAQFSVTAFKLNEKLKVDRQAKQESIADQSGKTLKQMQDGWELWENGSEELLAKYKEDQKKAAEAEAAGEPYEATKWITQSEWRKGRFGYLKQIVLYGDIARLDTDFQAAYPNIQSMSRAEREQAILDFGDDKLRQYNPGGKLKKGFPQALKDLYKQKLQEFRHNKLNEAINDDLAAAKLNLKKENYARVLGVFKVTDGEELKSEVLKFIDEFKVDE